MARSPRRKSDAARQSNQIIRNRTFVVMLLLGIATFALLFVKLYSLQIVQHESLQEKAVAQQTRSTVVTASRGTIYDTNGNVLAISATAETVFVSPAEIAENKDTQSSGDIAKGLSRILGVDEDTILKKMEKTSSQYEVVKLRADQTVADQVRRFINGEIDDEGNEIPKEKQVRLHGVYLETDSKRYYPYSTLAANVVGFVGTDNTGLYGLEAKYDSVLQGTSGLTVTAKNAAGTDLLYQYEQYYDAQNGDSLVLTVDTNVQYYLEKGIESMFILGTGVVILLLGWNQMLNGEFDHLYIYLFALVFGLIGFADDYRKVKRHQNEGLTARQKFVLQLAAAVAFLCLMRYEGLLTNNLYVPFFDVSFTVDWIAYLVFAAFVIVGAVNAVNLTDGIDGLAASVTFVVMDWARSARCGRRRTPAFPPMPRLF